MLLLDNHPEVARSVVLAGWHVVQMNAITPHSYERYALCNRHGDKMWRRVLDSDSRGQGMPARFEGARPQDEDAQSHSSASYRMNGLTISLHTHKNAM